MGHRKVKRWEREEIEDIKEIPQTSGLAKVILPIHGSFSKIHEKYLALRGKKNDSRRYKA